MAEVYWEFTSDNPTALVATLQPLLNTFTARHRESEHFRQDCDPGIEHNALSLRAEISRGRSIRIYAKTTRRIRIEVIYRLSGENFTLEGGHTANSWTRLPAMLSRLSEDAAELVNRLFAHFRERSAIIPSHISAYHLLLELARYSRDIPTALTITSLLVHNGCIAAGGMDERMQRAVHRLSNAGVLRYSPHAENYLVAPSRAHALQQLRSNGSFPLLHARRRMQFPAE